MNLLKETLEFLIEHDLTSEDVCWVGDGENYCNWNTFAAHASFNYDDSYGCQEINDNLIVVGKDWWLERHDYDGSEWWEFKRLPVKPKSAAPQIKIKAE